MFQWQPCWSNLIKKRNVRNKQILFQALIVLFNTMNPIHKALSVSHTPVCLQPWTAVQQSNRSYSKRPIVLRFLDCSGSLFCIQFSLCSEFARIDRWVEMEVPWPFTYHLPHFSDCVMQCIFSHDSWKTEVFSLVVTVYLLYIWHNAPRVLLTTRPPVNECSVHNSYYAEYYVTV